MNKIDEIAKSIDIQRKAKEEHLGLIAEAIIEAVQSGEGQSLVGLLGLVVNNEQPDLGSIITALIYKLDHQE